jgi:serine/threonine protein kinase
VIQPGSVLDDRYRVVDLIARGGMADVFRARDLTLNREVAVKAFRVGGADVARFHAETQLLARFDHPNLVRVFDAGSDDDQPYVVLELIPGPTLGHRLADGPLPEPEVRRLGIDLSQALAYVHGAGVVHRDVKPSNVLLETQRGAVLGDFGIALLLDATRLTAAAETVGTVAYLAPEQVAGAEITGAVDVYALGLVLVESLTGTRPFGGTNQEMMAARLVRPPAIPPSLAAPWPDLLAAMTSLEPAARPPVAEIATHLADPDDAPTLVANRTEVLVRPAGVVERTASRRPRWWAGLAVGAVLVALALAALAARDDGTGEAPAVSTTTPETSPPPTTAPPTTTLVPSTVPAGAETGAAACARLEAAKQLIEAEKKAADQQPREDKKQREALKKQLEAEKKQIEAQMKTAGC